MELFSRPPVTTYSGLADGLYLSHLQPSNCHSSRKAVLVLHGFPGWGNKNFDVAERLALCGYHCFLPHYPGLGHSPGVFTFEKSISSISNLVDKLQTQLGFTDLSCIGHSWGGFVALNIAEKIVNKLLWLSPLVIMPNRDHLQSIVHDLIAQHPTDCTVYSQDSMYETFMSLASGIDYDSAFRRLSTLKVRIVHGTEDTVLPIELSKHVADQIPTSEFISVTDDHSFTLDRRNFIESVQRWFGDA